MSATVAAPLAAKKDLQLRSSRFQLMGLTGIVGGGKDTQANLLSSIPGLSVVVMSAELDRRGWLTNPIGLSSDGHVRTIVHDVIEAAVQSGHGGVLIVGWPRSGPQAEHSLDIFTGSEQGLLALCPMGINLAVIDLTAEDSEETTAEIVRRCTHRYDQSTDLRRSEDSEADYIKERIRVYRERSDDVARHLCAFGILQQVNCLQSIEVVHEDVLQCLRFADVLAA